MHMEQMCKVQKWKQLVVLEYQRLDRYHNSSYLLLFGKRILNKVLKFHRNNSSLTYVPPSLSVTLK